MVNTKMTGLTMPPQRGERKKMNRVNQRNEGCSCSENEKSMRHLSILLRNVHTVLDNIMAGWIFCPVTINLLLWLLSHWFKTGCWAVGARMFSHFVCWKVKSETSERWQQNAAKNESCHADCGEDGSREECWDWEEMWLGLRQSYQNVRCHQSRIWIFLLPSKAKETDYICNCI